MIAYGDWVLVEEFKVSQFASPRWFVVSGMGSDKVGCEVICHESPIRMVGHDDYLYIERKNIISWRENDERDTNKQ